MSPKATTTKLMKRTWETNEKGQFTTPGNKSKKTSSKKSTKNLQILGTSMSIQPSTKKSKNTSESQTTSTLTRRESVRIAGMNEKVNAAETFGPKTAFVTKTVR